MSNPFRNWLKFNSGLRCCVPGCRGPVVDPAHIRTRGAVGDVDERNVVPLCRTHHTEQHAIGIKTFQKKYGVHMKAVADTVWEKWVRVRDLIPVTGHYDLEDE